MLNNAQEFQNLGPKGIDISGSEDLKRIHQFKFKVPTTEGVLVSYNLDFHQYQYDIYVGKFYPTVYSKEDFKFGLILNHGVRFANMVISTVLKVFQWMSKKYPEASFGFIGEPKYSLKVKKKKSYTVYTENKEEIESTKRYNWYLKVCNFVIDPDDYELFVSSKNSSILLINKTVIKTENYEEFVLNVEGMMRRNYPDFV